MSDSDSENIPQDLFKLDNIKVKVHTDNTESPENTYSGTPYQVGRQIRHVLGYTKHSKMKLELLEPRALLPLTTEDFETLANHKDLAFLAVNLGLTNYARIIQAAKNLGLLRND